MSISITDFKELQAAYAKSEQWPYYQIGIDVLKWANAKAGKEYVEKIVKSKRFTGFMNNEDGECEKYLNLLGIVLCENHRQNLM